MKTFTKTAAQGDVFLVRADDEQIPANYERQVANDIGEVVLAHSESGHDHVMEAETTELYSAHADAFIQYIKVVAATELKHKKSGPDAHESIQVPPGTYRVIRQRESAPEGFRRVED